MSEARLKSRLLVQAALRQAQARGVFGAVARAGDDDAGAILLLLRRRDGSAAVLGQATAAGGKAAWMRLAGADVASEETVRAYVARAIDRDPDLWVVEFDHENSEPPFEAILLPDRHGP